MDVASRPTLAIDLIECMISRSSTRRHGRFLTRAATRHPRFTFDINCDMQNHLREW